MDEATQQPKKRGRKPGTPKTGGRIKGTPNKATAEVKSLARQYGADMIDVLAKIAMDDERPESARVSAAKELLDRGYGKSIQQISGPDEGPIQQHIEHSYAQDLTDDELAHIVARGSR